MNWGIIEILAGLLVGELVCLVVLLWKWGEIERTQSDWKDKTDVQKSDGR